MSDTDDTDLLLLIPPDFFLVRSDFEDFDSDSDIGFKYREVRDTIVSDLITQVNDLESRICQVERASTHCSTCNEDSFINHSIISLTESDALRAQIKEQKEVSKTRFTDTSLMVKSPKGFRQATPELLFEKEYGIRKLDDSLVIPDQTESNGDNNFKLDTTGIDDDGYRKLNHDQVNQNQKTLGPEIQKSKEKHTDLLHEVDSFLLSKQLNSLEYTDGNNHQRTCQGEQEFVTKESTANEFPHPLTDLYHEDPNEQAQSLALTEVYKLVSEMEETQNDMLKKLSGKYFKVPGQEQYKSNETMGMSKYKSLSLSSKVLDLEDLSTRSPKSVVDKFINERNHFESLDGYRLTNSETNDLLELRSSTEERPKLKTSSLSPNRVIAGSYNPIDIVRANLPGRQDTRTTQFSEGNDSSIKSAGFRRQLNFEKPLSPLRTSKSKTSLHGDRRLYSLNQNQNKSESDKLHASFRNSRAGKTNHTLEKKFNSLAIQRASGANSEETQNTAYSTINKATCDIPQQKISSNNLLSLSELWNKEPTFYSDDPNKLRQKLEEERYRRQHCEQQIQALQVRVLEEQEKLAVAIRVDQEKDRAIMQITESWKKLNDHWGELEEQRHGLAQQLQAEREASKSKSEELNRKVERWEKEVSQALDLAAGYKEKSESIQTQMEVVKRDTAERLQEAENHLQKLTGENDKLSEENNKLNEQLQSLRGRLAEEEDLLTKLKAELEKSRKRLDEYEAENNILKEQKVSLTTSVKEERNRISILEQKLNSLQQALNDAHKNEKAALEEVRVSQERMEVARTELRALYQGQLEAVVKEKLQEFQVQLETAEAALKAELQNKEKHWAEKANDQCRQLHDKYKRDLLRVEEIHKADTNSWKEKLSESERLRAVVEKRLQEEADRRADIAQRLHSVMETQWREALNIISNPMKAMYEMPKEESCRWPQGQAQSPERLQGQGVARVSRTASTTSLGPAEDVPFCREGLVTYRTSQPGQDQGLKKYIQMLLERGPGNTVPPQNPSLQDNLEHQTFAPRDNGLLDKWIMENEKQSSEQSDKQNQFNKPPWR